MNAAFAAIDILHPLLARLLSGDRAVVMGVLNVTPDSFSDGGAFHRARRRHWRRRSGMIARGRGHSRHRRGIDPALWRRQPVDATEELRRLEPSAAGTSAARHAGLDRHHEGRGRRLGARSRRVDRQRRLGPAARSRHGRAWSPSTARPSSIMHNRDKADPAIDIMADIRAFFSRSLEIADARRHPARPHRARSRHRLRQDAGSKASPRWRGSMSCTIFGLPLLVGASRKRFIASVSPSPPQRAARRFDRRASACGRARRTHHPRPRRRRNRAGAARRRGDRGSAAMSDTIFVTRPRRCTPTTA